MIRQRVRDVGTNAVDLILQLIVKEVADHRHAAAHPLASASKIWVIELSHRAIAIADGNQHVVHTVLRYAVAIRKFLNKLLTSG